MCLKDQSKCEMCRTTFRPAERPAAPGQCAQEGAVHVIPKHITSILLSPGLGTTKPRGLWQGLAFLPCHANKVLMGVESEQVGGACGETQVDTVHPAHPRT